MNFHNGSVNLVDLENLSSVYDFKELSALSKFQ